VLNHGDPIRPATRTLLEVIHENLHVMILPDHVAHIVACCQVRTNRSVNRNTNVVNDLGGEIADAPDVCFAILLTESQTLREMLPYEAIGMKQPAEICQAPSRTVPKRIDPFDYRLIACAACQPRWNTTRVSQADTCQQYITGRLYRARGG